MIKWIFNVEICFHFIEEIRVSLGLFRSLVHSKLIETYSLIARRLSDDNYDDYNVGVHTADVALSTEN